MTPTVSMRPTVSDRFRETLFVDRFHVSRPIGKRGNGNGRTSSAAGTTVSASPRRTRYGKADTMTSHRASRLVVAAVARWQSNAIADDDNFAPRQRGAFVRCCNCRQIVPAAGAVDLRTTRRPPGDRAWECRPFIREVGQTPRASGAAMPAVRG